MIEELLEQHRQRALVAALGLCGKNRDDAEDLVQDASLRAWKAWDASQPVLSFWAWFEKILSNCWISKRNSPTDGPWIPRYRDDEQPDNVPEIISLDALLEDGWDMAAHGVTGGELGEAGLEAVRDALSPLQAQCVELCLGGYDYREIAELLDVSYEAVRQNVSRSRKKLESQMMSTV